MYITATGDGGTAPATGMVPDFRTMGDYLRKSDMGQLIYAFLYTVDPESKVAREHPDWLLREGSGWSANAIRWTCPSPQSWPLWRASWIPLSPNGATSNGEMTAC